MDVADRYNPTTTLTMPTHNNARVTANLNGDPLITGETRLRMTPERGPVEALSFFHKNYGSRRMLTYDWYDDINQKLGPDDDFEAGRCYTAQVEVKPVEGAKFDISDNLSMGLNHASGTRDISFTRVSDQLLHAAIRLLFKPVLTMELHPGDALPTAADLNKQLPVGYTVTTLTWADDATAVPGGATEMTLTELKISGVESRCQITGGAVVIDGTAYTTSDSYFNTLTLTNVKVPVKAKGVTVSGTVKSYNPNNATTIQLYEAGHAGEEAYKKYESTIDPTTDSGQVTQNFTFDTVAAGTYDLVVTKSGHLSYTVKNVEVGDTALDLTTMEGKPYQTITLLAGDVNRDGKINLTDLSIFKNNFGKTGSAVTNRLADITGDGKINLLDLGVFKNNFGKTTSACTVAY